MLRKTLGILGGMGPRATAYFFGEVLNYTEAEKDWDHLRIIIDNNVDVPSRTRAILYNEESPVEAMRAACIDLMNIGCDYIAVPCNSAHYFFDDVVRGGEIPWVNMLEVISEELKRFESVLILGGYVTVTRKIYDRYLDNTVYLPDNSIVYDIIEDTKKNNANFGRLFNLYDAINKLNVDCVLLGCTELPIVVESDGVNCEVIDGNEVYIKNLIKMCGGKVRNE
jgi:aspartate racemase